MTERIVLVTGGRAYRDTESVAQALGALGPIGWLVEGGATGADRLARDWARGQGIPTISYPARWRDRDGTYDPRAGFKRNADMLAEARPDVVLAFSGGKGTADMVARARAAGVPVHVVTPPGAWDDLLG